ERDLAVQQLERIKKEAKMIKGEEGRKKLEILLVFVSMYVVIFSCGLHAKQENFFLFLWIYFYLFGTKLAPNTATVLNTATIFFIYLFSNFKIDMITRIQVN
ncbi:hypothetical protein ACJX0J_029307, partial [Zea mays]